MEVMAPNSTGEQDVGDAELTIMVSFARAIPEVVVSQVGYS